MQHFPLLSPHQLNYSNIWALLSADAPTPLDFEGRYRQTVLVRKTQLHISPPDTMLLKKRPVTVSSTTCDVKRIRVCLLSFWWEEMLEKSVEMRGSGCWVISRCIRLDFFSRMLIFASFCSFFLDYHNKLSPRLHHLIVSSLCVTGQWLPISSAHNDRCDDHVAGREREKVTFKSPGGKLRARKRSWSPSFSCLHENMNIFKNLKRFMEDGRLFHSETKPYETHILTPWRVVQFISRVKAHIFSLLPTRRWSSCCCCKNHYLFPVWR